MTYCGSVELKWLVISLSFMATVFGTVDVYIKTIEMNRTLGVPGRLMYVVDGKQNAYQTQFSIPYMLKADIDTLNIWWKNKGEKDVSYIMELVVPEKHAVLGSVNVPVIGLIPRQEQKFTISLQCTGLKYGDYFSYLHINYTWPSRENPTAVVLKQRKICTHGIDARGASGHTLDKSSAGSGAQVSTSLTSVQMFYIAIGCVCGLVVIIASIIVTYFRKVKKPTSLRYTNSVTSPGAIAQRQPFLRPDTSSSGSKYVRSGGDGGANKGGSLYSSLSQRSSAATSVFFTAEPRRVDVGVALEQLKGDTSCFQLGAVEIEGAFGLLQRATWNAPNKSATEVPMMVKSLKPTASVEQRDRFLAESLSFHGLAEHAHICQVAAVFWRDSAQVPDPKQDTPLLCYVHEGFGNLKKFLLRCRGTEAGRSQPLRTQDLVSLGIQIIRGMLHLHRNKVLHRDLATRNCLITDRLAVQICDTALSRDMFPHDYSCLGDGENRPVKWMAIEALDAGQFTSASDVWSFGVTLWELVSMGQQPYNDINAEDVSRSLRQGLRLTQPYNCPDELYGVIFCCWGMHQQSRPTFEQLLVALDDFYAQLTDYV